MLDAPTAGRDSRLFETESFRNDLRRRSVRGAAVTMVGQASRLVIQVAGVAILARLLVPDDFGVFGKTIALTGFLTAIQTGGLSLATVQRAQITHEQISMLFWLNAALGMVAAGMIAAVSPAIAWFYNDPRVLWLGLAFAGAVAIAGLTVQHDALMKRQMRFTAIAVINIITVVSGFAAAILSAWRGAGYWALAVQLYANSLTLLILLLVFCRWLPGLPRRGTGVRPMVKIGANQTAFNLLNFANRNFDNVLIGRFVSDAALGFYTQAYRLLLLPLQQINRPISSIVLSALSRLQDQPERHAQFYYRAVGTLTFVSMPIIGFLLTDASPVISLVLGSKWLPVVPIFRALGIAAFVGTFNVAWIWVYCSLGRTDRQLKWSLIETPITLISFFLGLPWGAFGVAVSFSAVQLLLTIPSLMYCVHGTAIHIRTLLLTLVRPAATAVIASAALFIIQSSVSYWPARWIGLDISIYGIAYLATWLIMPDGRTQLRQFVALLDEFRS
ncbi:MAG TPA: lipopolysaccharide biosynthesis protein [Candidatus Acidoferrales bacterium]|nr:lipopolysaccharide biosynthesis protein [Candidatus Acidoferrales bacterium]